MSEIPEPCPIQAAFTILGRRWSMLVLWYLRNSTLRFGEIRRNVPEISDRMLSRTLQELESGGFVARRAFAEVPPRVEYSLTTRGEEVAAIANDLAVWAFRDAAEARTR
jgi:DNA-binding HxlR family transcriptional regulator